MTSEISPDAKSCIDPATGVPVNGVPLGLLLSAHAAITPDRPAVTFGDTTITFVELDAMANRRARMLEAKGVGENDRVVIALPNGMQFLECTFAAWKVGATVCPLSHKLTPEELSSILVLAEPAAILASDGDLLGVERRIAVNGTALSEYSDAPLPGKYAQNGRILTSGGSTGRPKLIVDPLPSVWGPEKAGFRRPARSTLLIASPLYHAAPFSYAHYALAQGSHVVCMERFDPANWLAAIERHGVDYAYVVPTIMTRIAKLDPAVIARADLSSIKTLLHMAAPCPPETKRWWIDKLGPEKVLELYGGSERIGLTLIDGREWLDHPGSVGKAAPGDEIVIVDDEGRELPCGEIGEIRFRKAGGPGATYSYIGAETRISGDTDSYGDMGRLDPDGYLYVADRRTDMVLLGGANIYPAEIEAVLESLPEVLCAAVIGLPDADMGNRLHAIVELAPEAPEPDPDAFRQRIRSRLPGFKCPRTFEFTRDQIRDDAGKVRRSALRESRMTAGSVGS